MDKLRIVRRSERTPAGLSQLTLRRYLATLAARDVVSSEQECSIAQDHELADFVEFKSEEEAQQLTETNRQRSLRRVEKLPLPKSPEVTEEEFMRVQQRIQKKSLNETMNEYLAGARRRRGISAHELEATAIDLPLHDEWHDLSDSYVSTDEDEYEVSEESDDDDDGRKSRLDFMPFSGNGDGKITVDDSFCPEPEVLERNRIEEASKENLPNCSNVLTKQFREEDTLVSGFHPKSTSTSIGHSSFDRWESDPDDDSCDVTDADPTVLLRESPPKSCQSSPKSSKGFTGFRTPTRSQTSTMSENSPSVNDDLSRTPPTMSRSCDLGNENSASCPSSQEGHTPIARRLRRLGLLDSPPESAEKTLYDSMNRSVQVDGTPKRPRKSLEELTLPTVNLAELVKIRVVEKNRYVPNPPRAAPALLEDLWELVD